jgi:purine nucleoside phosphorylase
MGKRTVKAFTARPWVAEKMENGTLPVIDEGIDCRQAQNNPMLGQKGQKSAHCGA